MLGVPVLLALRGHSFPAPLLARLILPGLAVAATTTDRIWQVQRLWPWNKNRHVCLAARLTFFQGPPAGVR